MQGHELTSTVTKRGSIQRLRTRGHIQAGFEEARRWFESVLSARAIENSRLSPLSEKLREMEALMSDPKRRSCIFDHVDPVSAHFVYADAVAFEVIARQFQTLGDNLLPRQLLKRSIQGPVSPTDEEPANSDGRNILAQLRFAANIMQKGLSPLGFEDLEFVQGGSRFFVECKRPGNGRPESFVRNLSDGNRQLKKVLDSAAGRRAAGARHRRQVKRGVLVMHIDRINKLNTTLPQPAGGDQLSREICYAEADALFRRYENEIAELDGRITIVFLVVEMLIERRIGAWGPIYCPRPYPRVEGGTRDFKRIELLVRAITDGRGAS